LGYKRGSFFGCKKHWKAIEETLYLNQFAGLVESIHDAASESLDEGTRLEELDW